jgi:hypothetical protein
MKRYSRRNIWLVLLTVILAVGLMGSAHPAVGGQPFVVQLTGAAEVPGPGDPDGYGTAVLRLNRGQERICWHINVSNIALPATGAHIHVGHADQAGAVVVPLSAPDQYGHASGCVNVDRELVKTIAKNPHHYYVNIHSAEFPAGAVRGQLR